MQIEPAHVDQVLRGVDGHLYTISGDVGGVVDDLKRIDPNLGVRFSEQGQCWIVFHRENEQTTRLVLTQKAVQGASGVWSGLDHRIVKRIEQIQHPSYDYVAEVAKQNDRAERARDAKVRDTIDRASDRAEFEARKALGVKRRAFVPK